MNIRKSPAGAVTPTGLFIISQLWIIIIQNMSLIIYKVLLTSVSVRNEPLQHPLMP